jgi:hypothetical protein
MDSENAVYVLLRDLEEKAWKASCDGDDENATRLNELLWAARIENATFLACSN